MCVLETIEAIRSGLMCIDLWTLGLCLVALLGCAISGKQHSCRFPWSRQARPSPEGVSPSFNWHRRGTFGEWARHDLGDFAFPSGTNGERVSSFSVFNGGRIRPAPRDVAHEICAVGVPMLAMQGASRFWCVDAVTAVAGRPPCRSKLLTWENFFLNADTNTPVSAQIELFSDGNFTMRSNNLERVCHRVISFDWDDDGLENSVDPDPLVAGPDAHGTNAEWYNTVCSNVFSAVEGGGTGTTGILPIGDDCVLSWREGVNSNAYYFVDVVTTNGPAPIYFTGDRESRLGNPVVVARVFETNHVPLLIGIDYAITSPVPFTVSYPLDYMYIEMETNTPCRAHVRWPLNFVFTENLGYSSRSYAVSVEPYDPGGVFSWKSRGGGSAQGGLRSGGCNCISYSGRTIIYNCMESCANGGNCVAVGTYEHNGASFAATGGVCRCGFDDPPDDQPLPHDPNDGPSLTISFSKPVVIFEDTYEYRPDVTEPRRSTRVRLTVDAYGGTHGGTLSLSGQNLDKLVAVGGGVPLPHSQNLAAGSAYHATGVYEGLSASSSSGDVRVSGSFTDAVTGESISNSAVQTAVRVMLGPRVEAPRNDSPRRHSYGVCELVHCGQEPSMPVVTWNPVGGGSIEAFAGSDHYRCPLDGCVNPLRAEVGAVHYTPKISVVEPDGMSSFATKPLVYSNEVHIGEAGGIGMKLHLYVTPLDVSFSEIAVEEVPCLNYEAHGYFENPYFNGFSGHTVEVGAGNWYDVDINNRFANYDEAAYYAKIPWLTPNGLETTNTAYAWTDGTLYMDNPFGWNVKGTTNGPPHKVFGEDVRATFMLDENGRVGVFKLDNWVDRQTNGVVRLFGPKEKDE